METANQPPNPDIRGSSKKVTKRPPIRPSSTAKVEDITFKVEGVDPWEHYQNEATLEPGYYLAFQKSYPHTTVFVRQIKLQGYKHVDFKPGIHRNMVNLYRVYIEESCVTMIYEATVASLKDILTFRPYWSSAETAAVCQGVLLVLKYIHSTLNISHGDVRAENISFDIHGTVKLANIGNSLLRGKEQYHGDLYSLALIVRQLAEQDTSHTPLLAEFLQALEGGQSATALLQHRFLQSCRGPEQVQHCVWGWLATRLFIGKKL